MGSNGDKSNIAISILEEKKNIFKGYQKLFCILMEAIIFSPTVPWHIDPPSYGAAEFFNINSLELLLESFFVIIGTIQII